MQKTAVRRIFPTYSGSDIDPFQIPGEPKMTMRATGLAGVPAAEADDLESRYSYQAPYVPDVDAFVDSVLSKTVIPYQVEVQPGRITGKNLCWLPCSYCYGGSTDQSGDRLTPERYTDLIRQTAAGPHGGTGKIIFAGYATDPLNYEHIEDIVETALDNRQITGFNTKALRVSDRLVGLLSAPDTVGTSYFNISVDAGSTETYNVVHGVRSKTDMYGKVLDNLRRISAARDANGAARDLSVSYLLTRVNNSEHEVENAIRDIADAGADLIRFTFPQLPRGKDTDKDTIIPNREEVRRIYERLAPLIGEFDSGRTRVLMLDTDAKFRVVPQRILPCLARFVFPTIGFDGHMYHCSQSSAPQFREMALGNLQVRDFWDAFYDYDTERFWDSMARDAYTKMERLDCRCDRKEQCVNALFKDHL